MLVSLRNLRRLSWTGIALLFITSSGATARQTEPQLIPFETISSYQFSGVKERMNLVITRKREWKQLWKVVHTNTNERPPLPDIDFARQVIVAVFLGEGSQGVSRISITQLVKEDMTMKVFIKETLPGESCGGAGVITQPYHIIAAEKIKKPKDNVVFEDPEQEIRNCQ